MKIEDTLSYNINKFSDYRKFKDAAPDFEIPDELEFMKRFSRSETVMKWLGSLLGNSRDLGRTCRMLKARFNDPHTRDSIDDSKAISILKNIWVIECL